MWNDKPCMNDRWSTRNVERSWVTHEQYALDFYYTWTDPQHFCAVVIEVHSSSEANKRLKKTVFEISIPIIQKGCHPERKEGVKWFDSCICRAQYHPTRDNL